MTQQHRTRNPKWKTRALKSRAREMSVRCFRTEVVAGRDQGVVAGNAGLELCIGTAPGNQLVVTDASVSRHHCVIEATEAGFLLRDLGSTNGTFLGGYRIERAFVEPGAVIGIGECSIRFECSDEEVAETLSEETSFGAVVGTSAAMRRLFALMRKIADSSSTVLITGETGTGKGLVAQALHEESARRAGPFLVVDCGAIPDSLIESELFGHEKGAFTGADQRRIGAFEAANGGTLFLDEIGELGLDMQPKLLRVLERRELRRVGGSATVPLDLRIIAATNRELRKEVNAGGFRADLLYRLHVMHLELPPLRARREDIPALVESFYRQLTQDSAARPPADLIQHMMRLRFPGNVRELRAAIERALVLGDLSEGSSLLTGRAERRPDDLDFTISYREAKEKVVKRWEEHYVPELVERFDGNLSRAARAVSMDRNHLRKLLRALDDSE